MTMSDDILAQLQNAGEEEREWLLLRLVLERLEPPLRRAVWAAAVPHWFDTPYLEQKFL